MGKNNGLAMNFSWSFIEKLLSQGASILISIILARLLSPEDYGVLTIVNVFIVLLNVFVTSGMGVALVQDQNVDDVTICTDFYLSILVGVLLYIVLYFSAPIIAVYYAMPQLTSVIRVLGLKIPVSSIYSIQHATLTKNMEFQKLVVPTVLSTIGSGVLGIVTAYAGWGVWALVTQALMSQILIVCFLAVVIQWKPKLQFSIEKAKQHFYFSSRVVAATLINTFVGQLYTLTIGKTYSGTDAAYYNNGIMYPQKIIGIIESSVNSVAFPAIANVKDSCDHVKEIMKNTIQHISFIIVPMMIGMALCGEHIIRVFLTEKWLPSVPYLQIVCLTFVFMPMNGINYEAVKAIGKGDLFLHIQLIKTIINVSALFIALPYGMLAIAWSGFITGFATIVLNAYPTGKYYDYGVFRQLKDLFPACMYCIPMVLTLSWMNFYLDYSSLVMLLIEVPVGAILYFAMAWIFKSKSMYFVIFKANELFQRKRNNEKI